MTLLYKFLHPVQCCIAVCRLEGKKNRVVVIQDSPDCLGILKRLIDAKLEKSTNIQTNQVTIL